MKLLIQQRKEEIVNKTDQSSKVAGKNNLQIKKTKQ